MILVANFSIDAKVLPMQLTEENITKFQALYKKHFGEISREQSHEQGVKLVQLMKLIYKPMTIKDYQNLQKHRQQDKSMDNKEGYNTIKQRFFFRFYVRLVLLDIPLF